MAKQGWADTGLEVLGSGDFDGTRLRRAGLYAVCFGATWCGPTRHFMPKFAARKDRVPARLAIADITSMESPLWDTFAIKITPSLVVFRDGVAAGRFDGRRFVGLREVELESMAELVRRLSSGPATPAAAPPERPP